jgi:hypothetical protein
MAAAWQMKNKKYTIHFFLNLGPSNQKVPSNFGINSYRENYYEFGLMLNNYPKGWQLQFLISS